MTKILPERKLDDSLNPSLAVCVHCAGVTGPEGWRESPVSAVLESEREGGKGEGVSELILCFNTVPTPVCGGGGVWVCVLSPCTAPGCVLLGEEP